MDLKDKIVEEINNNYVMLYMKGTKEMPMCGFSSTVVKLLNYYDVNFLAINVLEDPNIRIELSNYSDSAFTLSSSDGSEISMNQSSKLSLSGYSFDTTSSSDDINVYQTEISLSQIPEGQDIKIYLGDDSRLYFNHSFSSEIISQLNCSSGRTVDNVRINMPGIAYLNGNNSTLIGNTSPQCIVAD